MKNIYVNIYDNLPKLVIMILEINFQQFLSPFNNGYFFGAIEW
jgi:hypothetical protein